MDQRVFALCSMYYFFIVTFSVEDNKYHCFYEDGEETIFTIEEADDVVKQHNEVMNDLKENHPEAFEPIDDDFLPW